MPKLYMSADIIFHSRSLPSLTRLFAVVGVHWRLNPSNLQLQSYLSGRSYSALANPCPLQTDTFIFSIIHSQLAQKSFNPVIIVCPDNYPHKVTFKVKLTISKTRVFVSLKWNTYRCVLSQYLWYICRIMSCLKGFSLFYCVSHRDGMHMALEIYFKKMGQMKHAGNSRTITLKR